MKHGLIYAYTEDRTVSNAQAFPAAFEQVLLLASEAGLLKVVTTNPDTSQSCPDDRVNRNFTATRPNQLWLSDFTCVSSWQGMIYTAFIIDVFARKIVGWRVSTSMTTSFVLDALNQAICQRVPSQANNLVHHSDRGSQYLSIKYTERLTEAGIDPSVGSVGDSYDNAWLKVSLACTKPRGSIILARGNHFHSLSGRR